jgi:signal transduction histidine kinase
VWRLDKSDIRPLFPHPSNEESRPFFKKGTMEVFRPIIFDGAKIGTVYIKLDLVELRNWLMRYLVITFFVLLISVLAAAIVSLKLGKRITEPILDLARVAKDISMKKDYSVRARKETGDEIGTLVHTFNEMLDEIQSSGAELQKSHEKLEERVGERTAQLEASNKELEAFSYSVSHDLRAPLRAIDGFSMAVLEDFGDRMPPEGKKYLSLIRQGSQQMAQLIDDMLNLSRITRSVMKQEEVDLSQLGHSVINDLRREEGSRKVDVVIADGMKSNGDQRILRIALQNLFSNAWKFTSKREEAKIEFDKRSEPNNTLTYFVQNNGAGFDMAYVNKLFSPFQRLHSAAEFNGTGVGLATVQRIVSRHGGRIWTEAKVNGGATFYFTLNCF